jgi:penicillin amidase
MADQAYRALRITQRIDALLRSDKEKVTADELVAIQQDTTSVEAVELAPVLAKACPEDVPPHPASQVRALCGAVRAFDGDFRVSSLQALPFAVLMEELRAVVLGDIIASEKGRWWHQRLPVREALESALLAESRGEASPLFDDPRTPEREGLPYYVRKAAGRALDRLARLAGPDPAGWRWGKVHRLRLRGPLADLPLIGGWFSSEPVEEPGEGNAVRAEDGLPVRWGAALRLVAEMTDPPTVRVVLPGGNSGHPGDPHWLDQQPLWHAGQPFAIPVARPSVEAAAEGHLRLVPAGGR